MAILVVVLLPRCLRWAARFVTIVAFGMVPPEASFGYQLARIANHRPRPPTTSLLPATTKAAIEIGILTNPGGDPMISGVLCESP